MVMTLFKKYILFVFVLFCFKSQSQNETNNWYFGANAGLNFSTIPPTILTNGMLVTTEGCSSISDALGNILFYSDGITVYDKTHNIMSNGTGLFGNSSTTQSSIIVKEPGNNNIYYIFTLGASGSGSLCSSKVDMNLSAGMGSVTVKNNLLATIMSEKLTSVKHCNGKDTWVISHENNSNNFKCYLVSNSGINNTPIISSIGTVYPNGYNWLGNLKASPSGKRLGLALHGTQGSFELYDFDNLTGIVSNSLSLGSYPNAYGCEFSPDESKFYGDKESGVNFLNLYQWDLCAGSPTAIVASEYVIPVASQIMGMQLAKNNKIYLARLNSPTLAVIDNPNTLGLGCNYNHNGQSIAPKLSKFNLPNFMTSYFNPNQTISPFTYTINCNLVNFNLSSINNTAVVNCNIINTPTNVIWNFGDLASGANNTSTLAAPNHSFTGSGNYTVQLIINGACKSDTIKSVLLINSGPSLSISGNFTICAGEKATLTISGATSYTWNNSSTGTTTVLSPTFTTIYSVTGTGTNSCKSNKLFTITVNKCTAINETDETDNWVKLFPNPVKDELNVQTKHELKIIIYNALGKSIYQSLIAPPSYSIPSKDFEIGIYTVKIISNKGTKIMRLFKSE